MTAVLGTDMEATSQVLAAARASRQRALAEEANVLKCAAEWAALHRVTNLEDAACIDLPSGWDEAEVPIAGEGAPLVAEFCIGEFAAALGMTTDSGRRLLGHAVELCHRLLGCWERVVAGELPAWQARRIAELTHSLSAQTAARVDRMVAPVAHKIGPVQLERLVEEAIAHCQPELLEERRIEAAEVRRFDIEPPAAGSLIGVMHVSGTLDTADALDLEQAVAATARQLAEWGSQESLDVRRSQAVGEIARRDLMLPFDQPTHQHVDSDTAVGDPQPRTRQRAQQRAQQRAPRQVVLHVHLTDAALGGVDTVGRCEEIPGPVLVEQIKAWCGTAGKVVVRPVVDLAEEIQVGAYEIPDRLRRQIELRDHHCVFPYCQRRAGRCDLDHLHPYDRGGTTSTSNLAPLCRRHHRLKTFAGWTYTRIEHASYLWRSPHGYQFIVAPTGTTGVDP